VAETPAATWADLLELMSALDASGYAEVDIEMPGLRLRMSTTPDPPAPGPVPSAPVAPGSAAPAPADDDTAVAVVAPMLGTFYGRPAPDADPFVEVGDTVAAGTTVAIVEVMKLMNPVTAGVAGRVVEVRARDGDLVEHGDVLLRVEPAGSA
jgi:acetyl-CoA carboxylase biotin carboxyl carrier protein